MHLAYIEIRGIKSYENSGRIEFTRGINAISGQNGAGKSTILEAIGFAMFDAHPHTAKNFIREGSKNGEVVVGFVDALDGRLYEVSRSVTGSQGNPYIFDPQIKKKIVIGNKDVYAWIKDHLRVSQAGDLESLFDDAIGVQQGLLTASFQMRPSDRKPKFDRLLQVDEYENTFKWLGDTEKRLKELAAEERVTFERLKTRLEDLPIQQEQVALLVVEIGKMQEKLGKITSELDKVREKKEGLEALKERIGRLEGEIEVANEKLSGLETQLSNAEQERQAATRAKDLVDAAKPDYLAYCECEDARTRYEAERTRRDALSQLLGRKRVEIAALEAKLTAAKTNLAAVAKAEKEMARLQPIVEAYRRTSKELDEANAARTQRDSLTEWIKAEAARLARMESELEQVRTELVSRAKFQQESGDINTTLSVLSEELAQNKTGVTQRQDQIEVARERREFLVKSEAGECPVCQEPLKPGKKQELQDHYQKDMDRLEEEIRQLEARQKAIGVEQRSYKARLKVIERELERLPAPSREKELEGQIQDQKVSLQAQNDRLIEYVGLDEKIATLMDRKGEFNDPEGELKVQKAAAGKRPAAEKELRDVEEAIREKKSQMKLQEQELETFAGLDQKINDTHDQMEGLKEGYSQYVSNLQTAELLPVRTQKADSLSRQRNEASEKVKQLTRQVDEIRQNYQPDEHAMLDERFKILNREQAAAGASITSLKGQLKTAKDRVAELEPLVALKQASEGELDTLKAMQETLAFIRKTVREAGPYIVNQILQSISESADRIFGEILNDYTARLNWTQDYEIQLEQMGYSREFSQLSGGEKMAAALAVRLALLREMSEIRLAFFDEPTAHLDGERRSNLAEQITKIKGFEQLFVISHDDTFEDQTDLVLHVTKENGTSKIQKKGEYAPSE